MYKILIIWIGKFILWLSRKLGNGGSALPGVIALALYPNFIKVMAQSLAEGTVLVTGTNGKTTTTKFLYQILADQGLIVLNNRAGSNMTRGIASAFIEAAYLNGKIPADIGLFEVDEGFIPEVSAQLEPKVVVVLNLLRDQLDRYGELDRTASLIGEGLESAQQAVLNLDDPLVYALKTRVKTGSVLTFGAGHKIRQQVPHDALLHGGKSGFTRDIPQILLQKVETTAETQNVTLQLNKQQYTLKLRLPGVYNAYNAAAAFAAASALGLPLSKVARSLEEVEAAFGRTELIHVDGKSLRLLLVKNPGGFNQVLKTFLKSGDSAKVLMALNDNYADGRDVSWVWDVDFESIISPKHYITATGIRAYDMALRLKYADSNPIIVEPRLSRALQVFLDQLEPNETGLVIPTYTAMLEIRSLLAKQVKLPEVWE